MTTPPIDHLDVSDSETVRRHAATFRRARLARLAAVEALAEVPSDAEPPQVPARDAAPDEVPRGAAGIAKHARAHGWTVREVYSRSSDGVEAISVRARQGSRRAVGYYRAGKFAWALCVEPSDGVRKVGARELKAFLSEVG